MALPVLQNEVRPAMPLHHPDKPWLSTEYVDGSTQLIDLTRLFKEAHLIKTVNLNESASTVALLRMLISIAYTAYQDDSMSSEGEWGRTRAELLKNNEGFPEAWVDKYFSTWEDRFYLIHPTLPFAQDASLYSLYNSAPVDVALPEKKRRATFNSKLSSISNLYPNAASTASEDGQKVAWGLPKEEVYEPSASYSEKVSILLTSLLHHRFSHSATNRGTRSYYNDAPNQKNDDYHATHAFRCAVHYVPEGMNLYQTLLIAMKFNPEENHAVDLPEWEQEINKVTNLPGKKGYNVHYSELVASMDSPRSSVNMTHLSALLVPEYDPETQQQVEDGGQVQQLRRPLFNFKHYTGADGEKLPFPITWNPFIAIKLKDMKALKQTESLSANTAMARAELFKVPLLNNIETLKRPEALVNLTQKSILRAIPYNSQNISVYVFAGDASKDKTYNNFVLQERTFPDADTETVAKLESWFTTGSKVYYYLKSNLQSLLGENLFNEATSTLYWTNFKNLFESALQENTVQSIQVYQKDVIALVRDLYDNAAQQTILNAPLQYTKHLNYIIGSTYKEMKGKA